MKNICLFILSIIIASGSYAQADNKIVIGKVDSVYSTVLKEQRKIWVYVPNMNTGMQTTSQRFPVLYLLDGDAHFNSVVGMIQQLSQVNGNTIFPEMIVVAIPNTDRTRDLTPTHVESDPPMMDSGFAKTSGGGENFAAFLQKELIPHVDSSYLTEPFRVLVGHSFGGLAVMHILTNHSKLFNAYIAIDPSMWYDKDQFLKATQKKLASQKYDGRSLYVGIANNLAEGMSLEKMKKDTSINTKHIRSIFAMDKFIKSNSKNGLNPTRFLWDQSAEYTRHRKEGELRKWLARFSQHFLRIWDRQTALRVDEFIAISEHVKNRIKKYYNRDSKIIYPPVSIINDIGIRETDGGFYLIISRLFGHKNIETAIEAFNKLGLELVIIGSGPLKRKLQKIAGPNIKFLGHLPDHEIKKYYASCHAFIMPQEEDFGLTPVEAMSFGKPVLALNKGGAKEIIIEGKTGEFFDDPIPEAIADGIRRLNNNYKNYDPDFIINQTSRFSKEKFRSQIIGLVSGLTIPGI